jgi:hypothetical protein
MKTLILENDWEIDNSVLQFIEKNKDKFNNIEELTLLEKRDKQEILEVVLEADILIACSTFLNTDQINFFIQFLSKCEKSYSIYFFRFKETLNYWNENSWNPDYENFLESFKVIKKQHNFYSFNENDCVLL